jgi:hypothetical protein
VSADTTWRKLGQVYVAGGEHDWAVSHAFVPTALDLGDRIRVYAAFRDGEGVGRVGWVDVAPKDPRTVLAVSERPALDIGEPGMFDDNGVTPLSVCEHDGGLRMYYAGWQLGTRVRYFLFTGAAESRDGGETFERVSRVPVLDRSDAEPLTRTGACVRRGPGGWQAWYAGGDSWTRHGDRDVPVYELRYLESGDGLAWGDEGQVCIDFAGPDEHGFGRPAVLEEDGLYRMWLSVRYLSRGYRFGYAESPDGRSWTRMDERAGIDVSDSGWDSEMVAFASIVRRGEGAYLFYNGNGFGATGFGVAVTDRL